jgi:chromosome segregation ATPase
MQPVARVARLLGPVEKPVSMKPIPTTEEFRSMLERSLPAALTQAETRTREARDLRTRLSRELQALKAELDAKIGSTTRKPTDEERALTEHISALDDEVAECRLELRQTREQCSGVFSAAAKQHLRAMSPHLAETADAFQQVAALLEELDRAALAHALQPSGLSAAVAQLHAVRQLAKILANA